MLSTKVREKSIGKMRSMRLLAVLLVPAVALIMGAAAPQVWADQFEDAKIIVEVNDTDGDAGIQVFLDGEPWKEIEIKGPDGQILEVEAEGNLRHFGLTELFFESNEPNFGDMRLADILALFPEGKYKFKGKTTDGRRLRGRATLSHEIPCAPENLSPAEGDNVNSANDIPPITWNAVANKLDNDDAECSDDEIDIEAYQVIVENLTTDKEFSIFLEAKDTNNQVTLPKEFVTQDSAYKYEVLAIAENGNQTISETWFCTDLEACPEPE